MSAINSTINYLGSFLGCQSKIVNEVCDPATWKTLPSTWKNPLTFISPGKELVPGVCRNVTTLIECSELVKSYIVETGEGLISTLGLTIAAGFTIGAISRFSDKKHTVLASMAIAGAIGGAKLLGTTGDVVATAIGGDSKVATGVGETVAEAVTGVMEGIFEEGSPARRYIIPATTKMFEWIATTGGLSSLAGATTAFAATARFLRPDIFSNFATRLSTAPGMQRLIQITSADIITRLNGLAGLAAIPVVVAAVARILGLAGGQAIGMGTMAASSIIGIAASQRNEVSPISVATGIASSFIPNLFPYVFPYTTPVKIISSLGISAITTALTETALNVADQVAVAFSFMGNR